MNYIHHHFIAPGHETRQLLKWEVLYTFEWEIIKGEHISIEQVCNAQHSLVINHLSPMLGNNSLHDSKECILCVCVWWQEGRFLIEQKSIHTKNRRKRRRSHSPWQGHTPKPTFHGILIPGSPGFHSETNSLNLLPSPWTTTAIELGV